MTDPARRPWSDHVVRTALVLAVFALVAWEYRTHFQMTWMYELPAYGDAARTLQEEGKLAIRHVSPMELAYLEQRGSAEPPWPLTFRFPLFVWLLAPVFALFGAHDGVAIGATAALLAALAVLTHVTGRLLLPGRPLVAAVAATMVACNPLFWRCFVPWGYGADLLFAIGFSLQALLVARLLDDERPRLGAWAALGALGALVYLARFSYLLFVPAVAAYVFARSRVVRGRRVAAFLGGLSALVLPFYVYRQISVGSLQSLSLTGNLLHLQGASVPWLEYRTVALAPFVRAHAGALAAKWFHNLMWQLAALPRLFGYDLVMPFALVGAGVALTGSERSPRRHYLELMMLALAVQWVLFSGLRAEPLGRYYLWLAPALLLAGCACFADLVARASSSRVRCVALAAAIAIALAQMVHQGRTSLAPLQLPEWVAGSPKNNEFPELKRSLPANAWVASNVGVHLTWYTRHPSIDLPATLDDLRALVRKHDIRYVFIVRWPQGELDNRPAWRQLMSQPGWSEQVRAALGFARVRRLGSGFLFEAS